MRTVVIHTAALVAVATLAGSTLGFTGAASAAEAPQPRKSTNAAKVLKSLATKSEQGSGYSRSKFSHWSSKNGCDTRARVLKSESRGPVSTTSSCTVISGNWFSKYDGVTTTNPSEFDIDHMVPLAEAWGSGAKKWNAATRKAFANDTGYGGSLIAVTASTNRSKSDRDPAEWMPPNAGYRCTYAKTWIATKYRWKLSVDRAERRALNRVLSTECASKAVRLPARAKVKNGSSTSSKPSSSNKPASAYYKNCDAARAAGAAPVYAGDPGYGRHLDRDGDGVGCE